MICNCCGSSRLAYREILWRELIDEWRLGSHEVDYINRQQGTYCTDCQTNLRAMALASAIMRRFGYEGLFKDFVKGTCTQELTVLEVNHAGGLTPFLQQIPGHTLKSYPDIDMMAMPYGDNIFDLVVHSDTLEHVADPVRGLSECRRILKPGGWCAFTVPALVDRLTASRVGLPPSYHGSRANPEDCLVYTEYGADAWKHVIQAGFSECSISSLAYPAAQAFVGAKSVRPNRTRLFADSSNSLWRDATLSTPSLTTLFLDTGADFNVDESCTQTVDLAGPFRVTFDFGRPVAIKRLRWDPIELRLCQLWVDEISWCDAYGRVRSVDLAAVQSNGDRRLVHEFAFETLDPMLFIPVQGNATSVSIRGEGTVCDVFLSIGKISATMSRLTGELETCRQTVCDLHKELDLRKATWSRQDGELEATRHQVAALNSQVDLQLAELQAVRQQLLLREQWSATLQSSFAWRLACMLRAAWRLLLRKPLMFLKPKFIRHG